MVLYQNNFLKKYLSFFIIISILTWIYVWFCLFWTVPILIEPYLNTFPTTRLISVPSSSEPIRAYDVHRGIDSIIPFSAPGICFLIYKFIQDPTSLIITLLLTSVWLISLIESSKKNDSKLLIFLFLLPFLLLVIENTFIMLLAIDHSKSLTSLINIHSETRIHNFESPHGYH